MSTLILSTKLYIPQDLHNHVPRQRLVAWLNQGFDRKLSLLSAPAGFGKTTLLGEWINQLAAPVGWLSLDEQDNDLIQFLAYLSASLRAVNSDNRQKMLDQLEALQSDGVKTLLISLINQLMAIQGRFGLVLDDYHLIQNQEIHEALTFLIENQPPNMHLVISSRIDPPLRLAQFRARGELCEIRAADLRFTVEEALDFLNQQMRVNLSPSDVSTLTQKTEGWIAGLQLAAISLHKHPDKSLFVSEFAGDDRFITEYLLEEALMSQPSEVQTFLLQTSILEQFCASLCDSVTGRQDSQEIISALERENIFVIPLDQHRSWYRYHHLFAELLQLRLKQSSKEEITHLYQRTSAWYLQQNQLSQAAHYALLGKDIQSLSQIMERNTFAVVDSSELVGLIKQLDRLPDAVIRAEPWIALTKAWMLAFTGQFPLVIPLLDQIEQSCDGIEFPDRSRVTGRLLTLRAYHASAAGDKMNCIQLTQEAMQNLPADDSAMRAFNLSLAGNAYRDIGKLVKAIEFLQEAITVVRRAEDSVMLIWNLCRLVAVQRLVGNLNQAQATCQEALEVAEAYHRRTSRRLPAEAIAKLRMSIIEFSKNELATALRLVDQGLEICQSWGHYDVLLYSYRLKAQYLQAVGDKNGALDALDKRLQILRRVTLVENRNEAMEADIRISFGELDWADHWAASNQISIQDEINYQKYYQYFVFLRLLRAQGKQDECETLLERLLAITEEAGAVARQLELLAFKAAFLYESKKIDEAIKILNQALAIAKPEGFIRPFINQGKSMVELLYQASMQGIQPEFCTHLINQFSYAERPQARSQLLIEQLSNREIEILVHIARGSTNQEIAQELFLSVYTVKSHARNIFSKLGVNNRTEAVLKAHSLGILSPEN